MVTKGLGVTYALLHEVTDLSLIFDLNELLAAIGRVRDVQLHLVGGCRGSTVVGCCWMKSSRENTPKN